MCTAPPGSAADPDTKEYSVTMNDADRKHAWSNAKAAVRSYAKDPTAQSAERVEEAWNMIGRMDSLSHWRERREARLNARSVSARSGQAE